MVLRLYEFDLRINWAQYVHTVRHIWFHGSLADYSYFMDDFGNAVECKYHGYGTYLQYEGH